MRLKRQISILLAIFILLLNSNLFFVSHFCKDNLALIKLTFQKNDIAIKNSLGCCDFEDKTPSNKSCCKDKKIEFDKKIDLSFNKQFDFHFEIIFFENNFISLNLKSIKNYSNNLKEHFITSSNSPPIYLKNCQLVFYA